MAVICLGMIVDDTTHFISSYQTYKHTSKSQQKLITRIYKTTGFSLTITTCILVAGFGVLTFASFKPVQFFGLFTVIGLIIALCADLIFLPPLLMLGERLFKRLKK